jgi:hypothetical protein
MNIHTLHADHSERSTYTHESLRQRLARWFKAAPPAHGASDPETDLAPAVWPEVPEIAGRPYVIGPGTLLVMTYMRKRMR